MSYKCVNKECKNLNKIINPGGKIIIIDGNSFFTGSICVECSREMQHISNKMGNFKTINNPGDGRNL